MKQKPAQPSLGTYLIATRPWSFSMSLISVSLGTLIAGRTTAISWAWYGMVALGAILCHAAGNVLNDFFDAESGVDQLDSATANYRPHPVLGGLLSPRAVLLEGVVLLALATILGLALTIFRTSLVFWIALVGLALNFFYTGGPLRLKYRALGELVVFLIWGPLMFQGAFAVQTGRLSARALLASVPFGVLVALVLFANNIRDREMDARIGIRTLATVLGHTQSLKAFQGLIAFAYGYVLLATLVGGLTPCSLLVFLSLPLALGLVRRFQSAIPQMADALTARLDTAFGALFVAGLFLDHVLAS